MIQFIKQANQWGAERRPFFFLIDFEQQKPQIFNADSLDAQGVHFHFPNMPNAVRPCEKAFQFQAVPLDFQRYQTAFSRVKHEIQQGNSYLLNLTFPTEIHTNYSLGEIFYSAKAKYKCWLENQFVCFSPECFIRIEKNKIYSYPMKGTINANEEQAVEKLLNSTKEFSEHNTIVDLIRNDLALVAENIQVTKYRYVEKVDTHRGAIYQTSSEICGDLAENWQGNIGTMLAKLLPAGSISGAPKVKTVEIIQQAEGEKRGYYTGVFGYFDGENLDSAVAIRYIEQQGEKLFFRSGGGITFLSELNDEYNEILEKVYVPISVI